jgi:4-amino-4-deoxy-L-arabinose transferase-like glycosyltransferase
MRAIRLESGLWLDEVVTLVEYVRLPAVELVTTYTTPNNHILFSLMAKIAVALFGESAWSLRFPAFVFGIASIWALHRLALQVVDRRQAFLAAALMSVSYHHVWFSQNARGYTALLFWTLLATSLFLEGMRRRARGLWVGYASVLALTLYTHLSGVFVFAIHGLTYFFLWSRRWLAARRAGTACRDTYAGAAELWPLLGFALGGLLALQMYAILVPQIFQAFAEQAGAQSVNVKISEWMNPFWTAVELARGLRLGFASILGALFVAGLGAVGFVDFLRRAPVLAILMVMNIPLTLAVLLAIHFHIWPRYFFVNLGFAALILVHGAFVSAQFLDRKLDVAERLGMRSPKLGTVLVAALILASALSLPANYRIPKQDYASARDFVESVRGPEDLVVTAGLAARPYREYYAPEWTPVASAGELDAIQKAGARTWLVFSFPIYMRSQHPDILDRADADFEMVREFPGSVGGGTIYVWRSHLR